MRSIFLSIFRVINIRRAENGHKLLVYLSNVSIGSIR